MYEKLSADVEFLNGNYAVAADMFLEGARDGDSLAAFNYAYCLWRGIGVERDPLEAKSFFTFAKNLDGGEACYNLAVMYLFGDGVPRNYSKAINFMNDAARLGCIEAKLYMGMAYTLGAVFMPDVIGISMIPYHKAEYRDPYAPALVGDVLESEEEENERFTVIRADARRAFEWFRSAAHHNPTYVSELVAKGQFLYAKCYLDGLGTEFDRNRGLQIMMIAGKSGSGEAIGFLRENGIPTDFLASADK